jgi:ThiF family
MLRADFIRHAVMDCRNRQLCYLAILDHGGDRSVGFSPDDVASRTGLPSAPGRRRRPAGRRPGDRPERRGGRPLARPGPACPARRDPRAIGASTQRLYPDPPARPPGRAPAYDRQARLFGDRDQDLLRHAKVGVIGAGGVGSLVIEQLARLGVGWLLITDPDRIDITNLPRVVGSTRLDARGWLTDPRRPSGSRGSAGGSPPARSTSPDGSLDKRSWAAASRWWRRHHQDDDRCRFADCEYLFLAADGMQPRLVFNALVHQYLIPGVQMGAKIVPDKVTGEILDVFSVSRPLTPDRGRPAGPAAAADAGGRPGPRPARAARG